MGSISNCQESSILTTPETKSPFNSRQQLQHSTNSDQLGQRGLDDLCRSPLGELELQRVRLRPPALPAEHTNGHHSARKLQQCPGNHIVHTYFHWPRDWKLHHYQPPEPHHHHQVHVAIHVVHLPELGGTEHHLRCMITSRAHAAAELVHQEAVKGGGRLWLTLHVGHVPLVRRLWSSGELCAAVSAFGMALSGLGVKLLQGRVPTFEILLINSLMGVILWIVLAGLAHQVLLYSKRAHIKHLLVRGAFGAAGRGLYYFALEFLPLASAVTLHLLHPAFASVIAFVVLREPLRLRGVLGIIISLVGVFLQSQPPFLFGGSGSGSSSSSRIERGVQGWSLQQTLGIIIGIGSAVTAAVGHVSVRFLKETESPLVMTLYYQLGALLLSVALLGAGVPQRAKMPGSHDWPLLMLTGVSLFSGHLFMDRALQLIPAARGTAVSMTQVLYSYIFGALVLGEEVNTVGVMGAVLVIIGVLIIEIRAIDVCAIAVQRKMKLQSMLLNLWRFA